MAAIVPDDVCRELGKRIANDVLDGYVDKKHGYIIRQIANMLENEELVPVRHGRFIGTEFDGYADGSPVYYEWQCSECGCVFEDEEPAHNYCPNCGAKMDG